VHLHKEYEYFKKLKSKKTQARLRIVKAGLLGFFLDDGLNFTLTCNSWDSVVTKILISSSFQIFIFLFTFF